MPLGTKTPQCLKTGLYRLPVGGVERGDYFGDGFHGFAERRKRVISLGAPSIPIVRRRRLIFCRGLAYLRRGIRSPGWGG